MPDDFQGPFYLPSVCLSSRGKEGGGRVPVQCAIPQCSQLSPGVIMKQLKCSEAGATENTVILLQSLEVKLRPQVGSGPLDRVHSRLVRNKTGERYFCFSPELVRTLSSYVVEITLR